MRGWPYRHPVGRFVAGTISTGRGFHDIRIVSLADARVVQG
jgi:hypothetical protein